MCQEFMENFEIYKAKQNEPIICSLRECIKLYATFFSLKLNYYRLNVVTSAFNIAPFHSYCQHGFYRRLFVFQSH